MHAPVFLRLFVFSQAISIIKGNIDDHGFCHEQKLNVTFCVYCGSGVPDFIAVTIVAGENDPNGAYQLFCVTPQWFCSGSMTRTYNTTSDTIEIGFIFNHTIHAGRYLRIIRERNGSQENQQILLKPCFSEFTTNASFYNESLITVSCQHSSFNYSNSPIRIKIEDGTEFGACSKMGCFGCKRLPDGIQCMVPYIPGKAIQCILDGAVYNISAPDISTTALTSDTTETISTTLRGTSKDTTYMTQDTSYTSPEIELPTTSNENSNIGRVMSTEKSTKLQNVTTIPESSATSSKIITTTVENYSMSREQNVTTALTKGSSTSKSILTTDNLPGSLNITTEYPKSLSTEQDIVSFSEGQSASKSIKSTDNLTGSLNMTTESTNSLPTEERIVTSTEDLKPSVETIGSRSVKEETTTEYLGTTVKPTNASSNGAITIINQNIIDQGFCHQQDVNIQLYINCGIPFSATITVAIVESKHEINPNTILTCGRSNDSTWYCPKFDIMTGKYNSSSGILDINFQFNFTVHAGYYVRMISSCDRNKETKHIHLIPCFSGFTVNATFYNATSLVINCQHTSFNDSSSTIRIKLKGGNDLGACSKISCDSCKRLRDGIQCYVLYAPESIYQCVLDGAIYNISLPTTQPGIQTTTPQNVSTSQRGTTASENINVSEKSVLTSTDSSSTTSQRIITSSERSTANNSFTKTSSEGTTVKTFDLTLTKNTQATFSKDHLTTESTESGEISTSQDDLESSSTSRENVKSTVSAPHFELTSIQSTKIITTAPRDVSESNVQSSFFNDTSVIINCQHTSFNYSSSVIRIKSEGGDDYGSCFKTMCNGCKSLPGGIQCIVPYTPGKIFQCIFDGAVYNISLPANHVAQTTLPGTTITSERTTAISEYHSSVTTSMTSKILESSTTQIVTSPARLTTKQSLPTWLTNITTEEMFRTTEPESPLTSQNIKSSSPNIILTSTNTKTTFPSEITTSPNVMQTSSSIFATSNRNTVMTTLPETQTSERSTVISTLQPPGGESVIIFNKDVLNQGLCHLNGVKIDLNITCKMQSLAKLDFFVEANENAMYSNIFLTCVRPINSTWNFHVLGSMTGKYNASFDLLEITLNLNYTVYAGHYLRIVSSCDNIQDTKQIHLKACLSGFTVNAIFHNEFFISARCQHSSFNYSNSPIRIKIEGGNVYGACSRNSCNACTRLPNGIECKVPYIPGEELQCILDGAIYKIPVQNMTPPGITTLLQILTTPQHIKTTPPIRSTTLAMISTESLTTTYSTPTTSPKSSETSQNTPLTSTESLTSMKSIQTSSILSTSVKATIKITPTTSQKSKTTTTSIPTTSQRSIITTTQTTFKDSVTTTKTSPKTHGIITSTQRSSETPHGNIKSTTPTERTYDNSGTSVVQRTFIETVAFLIVLPFCVIYS